MSSLDTLYLSKLLADLVEVTSKEELVWDSIQSILKEIAESTYINPRPKLKFSMASVELALYAYRKEAYNIPVSNLVADFVRYHRLKKTIFEIYSKNCPTDVYESVIGKYFIGMLLSTPENDKEEILYVQYIANTEIFNLQGVDELNITSPLFLSKPLKEYLRDKYPELSRIVFEDVHEVPTLEEVLQVLGELLNIPQFDSLLHKILGAIDTFEWMEQRFPLELIKEGMMVFLRGGFEENFNISLLGFSPIVSKYSQKTPSEIFEGEGEIIWYVSFSCIVDLIIREYQQHLKDLGKTLALDVVAAMRKFRGLSNLEPDLVAPYGGTLNIPQSKTEIELLNYLLNYKNIVETFS